METRKGVKMGGYISAEKTDECENKYLVKDPIFKAFGLEAKTRRNGTEYIHDPNYDQ